MRALPQEVLALGFPVLIQKCFQLAGQSRTLRPDLLKPAGSLDFRERQRLIEIRTKQSPIVGTESRHGFLIMTIRYEAPDVERCGLSPTSAAPYVPTGCAWRRF